MRRKSLIGFRTACELMWGKVGIDEIGVRDGGNLEYLAHLSAIAGSNPTEWLDECVRLSKEAR